MLCNLVEEVSTKPSLLEEIENVPSPPKPFLLLLFFFPGMIILRSLMVAYDVG